MKTILLAISLAVSSSAFAQLTLNSSCDDKTGVYLSTSGQFLEVHVFSDFGALLIAKQQASQFVLNSEKVMRGETSPFCEKISDSPDGALTEYGACYFGDTIELKIFENFGAISLHTSCVKAALSDQQ